MWTYQNIACRSTHKLISVHVTYCHTWILSTHECCHIVNLWTHNMHTYTWINTWYAGLDINSSMSRDALKRDSIDFPHFPLELSFFVVLPARSECLSPASDALIDTEWYIFMKPRKTPVCYLLNSCQQRYQHGGHVNFWGEKIIFKFYSITVSRGFLAAYTSRRRLTFLCGFKWPHVGPQNKFYNRHSVYNFVDSSVRRYCSFDYYFFSTESSLLSGGCDSSLRG
jgi:hypothetical protein